MVWGGLRVWGGCFGARSRRGEKTRTVINGGEKPMANRNAGVSAGPASVGSGFPIPTKMKRDTAETTVDMMYPARGLHQRVNRLSVYSVSNGVPNNSAKTSPAVIDSRTLDARTKSAHRRPRIGI